MLLSSEDAALFFRAWVTILIWVNDQRRVVPPFEVPTPEGPIAPAIADPLRKVLWADDDLREQFLAEGARGLGGAERDLIASWRHRVDERFVLFRHLKKHSIFLSEGAYAVIGIKSPLDVLFPSVPTIVSTVLLPFRDKIITDGLFSSPGALISFGAGTRRGFRDQYNEARGSGKVVTTLPAPSVATPNVVRSAAPKRKLP